MSKLIQVFAVSIVAALAVAAGSPAALAQAPAGPVPRSISASGESSIYVTPDEVVINVGVETAGAKIDTAKRENDQRSRTLLDAIKAQGVEAKHIQTADVNLEIDYDTNGPARVVKGYVARREYTVTLKDPKKTEALVDACLTGGANLLLGIDYRTTELRKHRDEARRLAVRAAKEKAELLAAELGERVGRPSSVSEGSSGYHGWTGGRGRGAGYMTQNSFQVQDGGVGVAGETIPIGQIAITASVSVTFDLRD